MTLLLILGTISFASKRNHLLMTIMSVEFLSLILFTSLILILSKEMTETYNSLYFLVLSTCEGALSLSVIVTITRGNGNDLIFSTMTLQC